MPDKVLVTILYNLVPMRLIPVLQLNIAFTLAAQTRLISNIILDWGKKRLATEKEGETPVADGTLLAKRVVRCAKPTSSDNASHGIDGKVLRKDLGILQWSFILLSNFTASNRKRTYSTLSHIWWLTTIILNWPVLLQGSAHATYTTLCNATLCKSLNNFSQCCDLHMHIKCNR